MTKPERDSVASLNKALLSINFAISNIKEGLDGNAILHLGDAKTELEALKSHMVVDTTRKEIETVEDYIKHSTLFSSEQT